LTFCGYVSTAALQGGGQTTRGAWLVFWGVIEATIEAAEADSSI
jgi:hypothetical protein